jgi:flagellar biosynthetic protein FliR
LTPFGSETVLLTFVIFCRIGGCLMLMPGFSSSRVPVQVRLFLAVGVTLALTPLLLPKLQTALPDLPSAKALQLIVSETLIGGLLGLMGRLFFLSLQFMAVSAASFVGFGNLPGTPIEDAEPNPPFASLITLTATVLIFLSDQHWEVFRALLSSYASLPVTEFFGARFGLTQVADVLSDAFVLALRISGPFVVYSLIVNLMFGIANKLTPQIAVYFISLPFVIAGGLFLLYFTIGEFLRLFITGFTGWLTTG